MSKKSQVVSGDAEFNGYRRYWNAVRVKYPTVHAHIEEFLRHQDTQKKLAEAREAKVMVDMRLNVLREEIERGSGKGKRDG